MASAYASRYARAFSNVAAAHHLDTEAAQRQLRDFAATLAASRPLREVVTNPSIPAEQKLRVVDSIADRLGMARQVRNFVAVIMTHERLLALDEILDEYAALADTNAGMTEVSITTARPIDEDERRDLEAKASELAGGAIRTRYTEDPSLLGGAVLRIGSTIYDGSLRAQFAGMKQRLGDARSGS